MNFKDQKLRKLIGAMDRKRGEKTIEEERR